MEDNNYYTFAQILKEHMDKSGLSKTKFAEELQIDRRTLTRWLSGEVLPTPTLREELAKKLDDDRFIQIAYINASEANQKELLNLTQTNEKSESSDKNADNKSKIKRDNITATLLVILSIALHWFQPYSFLFIVVCLIIVLRFKCSLIIKIIGIFVTIMEIFAFISLVFGEQYVPSAIFII